MCPAADFPAVLCTPSGTAAGIPLDGRSIFHCQMLNFSCKWSRAEMVVPPLSPCLCLHVTWVHCWSWRDDGGEMGLSATRLPFGGFRAFFAKSVMHFHQLWFAELHC